MENLKIQISGPDDINDPVEFSSFLKQLESIRISLNDTSRIITKQDKPVKLDVVELSLNSPATVELGQHGTEVTSLPFPILIDDFFDAIEVIQYQKKIPANFDSKALKSYQAMSALIDKHISRLHLSKNGRSVDVYHQLYANVTELLGHRTYSHGSVNGKLEKVNIHSDLNVLHIFPTLQPTKGIACHFKQDHLADVTSAVGKYVTIYGNLAYNIVDVYPEEISVIKIEIIPDQSTLPDLRDLHGIAPNATGEVLSEDFIKDIRNAW